MEFFDEYLQSNITLKINTRTIHNYIIKVILLFKVNITNTPPGKNLVGFKVLVERSLRRIVSVRKSGVMWTYLKTPSAGYTVKPHYGSMQLTITRYPRLI